MDILKKIANIILLMVYAAALIAGLMSGNIIFISLSLILIIANVLVVFLILFMVHSASVNEKEYQAYKNHTNQNSYE